VQAVPLMCMGVGMRVSVRVGICVGVGVCGCVGAYVGIGGVLLVAIVVERK
jgi:hypothetical protein